MVCAALVKAMVLAFSSNLVFHVTFIAITVEGQVSDRPILSALGFVEGFSLPKATKGGDGAVMVDLDKLGSGK
ncbi:lipase [Aspergillus luchuensis]|uniref:Lipase n=1 Tax=Aspergillus kawachii TaxID=1069201 RepID=A0A146FR47_ASPKA|nr:lipase [Aspergillus luchuensis]